MAEIAQRAGVALSTVSYVLSGKRSVSDTMRIRVQAAVDELDYRPHGPARALASGRSRTISLLLPSPHWDLIPLQQTFVAGATHATSANGYGLLLSVDATDPETIARLVETQRIDGVILMETLASDPRVSTLQASGLPFSLIGRVTNTEGISYVDIDFGSAVRKSVAHLVDLGHHCVTLLNFPQEQLDAGYMSALIAQREFEVATAAHGIRGIHRCCPHASRDARAITDELLASQTDCTAAITTGWQFTGLLAAIRANDLHVPRDFSVVSVIGAQYAEMLTPALTGIEWPAFEAGRLAAEMLIDRIADRGAPPRQQLIGGELVIRESTGPPPQRPRDAATKPVHVDIG